jgi:hypothetical protein
MPAKVLDRFSNAQLIVVGRQHDSEVRIRYRLDNDAFSASLPRQQDEKIDCA